MPKKVFVRTLGWPYKPVLQDSPRGTLLGSDRFHPMAFQNGTAYERNSWIQRVKGFLRATESLRALSRCPSFRGTLNEIRRTESRQSRPFIFPFNIWTLARPLSMELSFSFPFRRIGQSRSDLVLN